MMSFVVIQKCFYRNEIKIFNLAAESEANAFNEMEESIATNDSQEWLLTVEEFNRFKNDIFLHKCLNIGQNQYEA